MKKLTVNYKQIGGHVFPDGESEKWVELVIKTFFKRKENVKISVSSALLIRFFLLKICQGSISKDEIEFTFDEKTLEHNEYGRISHWPEGYCDIPIKAVEKLLILAAKKSKKAREN